VVIGHDEQNVRPELRRAGGWGYQQSELGQEDGKPKFYGGVDGRSMVSTLNVDK
jgi:hypothetical protein